MPEVAVTDTIQEDALVITMAGDLDMLTTPACADRIKGALASSTPGRPLVVLDMRRVDFCGSVGLRMLTEFATMCADQGMHVCVLATPRGVVTRILELTRLDTVLPVFEDLAAATAAFSGSAFTPLPRPRTSG